MQCKYSVTLLVLFFVVLVSSTCVDASQQDVIVNCLRTVSPTATIILEDDERYNDFRIGTNFRYDNMFPTVIVAVKSIVDIQAGVICATNYSMVLDVMNGGHSYEGYSCGDSSIMLHMDDFNNATSFDRYSPSGPTVTVQSGMRLARLYGLVINETASWNAPYVIAGGTCPTVGVAGHILCGGYGLLGREVGLTSDQVRSMEVVLANASVVTVTADEHAEIFWALRGSCSASFGVIATITLQLLPLSVPAVTLIKIPDYYYGDVNGVEVALRIATWWQVWASVRAPSQLSSTLHINDHSLRFQLVYLGPKEEAILQTLPALTRGLKHTNFSAEDIKSFYVPGTFLDAVLWWSNDESITSLEDLMAVTALPPLSARNPSRRKTKSQLLTGPMQMEALRSLFAYRMNNELNQIEVKAYSYPALAVPMLESESGGVGGDGVGGGTYATDLFTDSRSPLLRGHMLEMHYGKSYVPSSTDNTTEQDAALVEGVNAIGRHLRNFFPRALAYPGYIDADLINPGADYFGVRNAQTLSLLRRKSDPHGVLSSRAGEYLYP